MQEYGSKRNITSGTSSSRASEKKIPPTHMIIQREHDNRMVLLPVTHLVNSSTVRIKLSNTTTFRHDLNNRKRERGKIIQLGQYSICSQVSMFL